MKLTDCQPVIKRCARLLQAAENETTLGDRRTHAHTVPGEREKALKRMKSASGFGFSRQ